VKLTVSGTLVFDLEKDETPGFLWSITSEGVTTKNVSMLILPITKQVTASIQPVDAKGNPAQIDGMASWSSSNPQIANITNVSSDSLKADIVPAGTLGTCQINVQADADLGSGTKSITGLLDLTTVAGEAVGFTISTSEPQDIAPSDEPRTR
jgi:hypothetical protein